MKLLHLLSAGAILVAAFPAQSAQPVPSLCAENEHVVFSCAIGHRVASLCMIKAVDGTAPDLRYRFGRVGLRPELEYPKSAVDPSDAFKAHFDNWAKGMYSSVSFSLGDYSYMVYSRHAAFEEDSRSNGSGVKVTSSGGPNSDLWCDNDRITDNIWAELGSLHLKDSFREAH